MEIDLNQLQGKLGALANAADLARVDHAPALRATQVYLRARALESFDRSQTPDGVPWKPLKRPRNRKRDRRAKGGTGQKPLRDTGLLMASMTAAAGSHAVRLMGRMFVESGSNLDRAEWHNEGTRTIPARPFAGVTGRDVDKIGLFVLDNLARQVTEGI